MLKAPHSREFKFPWQDLALTSKTQASTTAAAPVNETGHNQQCEDQQWERKSGLGWDHYRSFDQRIAAKEFLIGCDRFRSFRLDAKIHFPVGISSNAPGKDYRESGAVIEHLGQISLHTHARRT